MRIVASYLAKFLEDLCLVLRRDPDPGVTDRNLHRAVGLLGGNADPSSLRCKLHRVGKEVEENLFDLALITNEIPKALINRNLEIDAMLGSTLAHESACVVYCQRKIERSNF